MRRSTTSAQTLRFGTAPSSLPSTKTGSETHRGTLEFGGASKNEGSLEEGMSYLVVHREDPIFEAPFSSEFSFV